jgi:hypothetical protein
MTAQVPVMVMSIESVTVVEPCDKIGNVDELTVLTFPFLVHSVRYCKVYFYLR